MASHPEHEGRSAAPDREKSSDSKASGDSTPTSKAGLVPFKLKHIANYAMRGFAPVLAVLALVIGAIAIIGNQSSQAQISKAAAKLVSMSVSLSAAKGELEKLKAAMAKENAKQVNERKKQNERLTKIIQNVTQLQVKMKISPTLEEQLHQPSAASAVTPSVAGAAAAPVTATIAADTDKKPGAKVNAIKEVIEKFNKK